ncbi:unnamed protein product [Prorocentrum cordatum]|uniref:Uncharacterized protein n=1 Tax=Prorocentrum cordatum TaxID=2364126 RepID=A0ABN9YE43_9DINO|nr:unnamed protein product [Polarella glacialis]
MSRANLGRELAKAKLLDVSAPMRSSVLGGLKTLIRESAVADPVRKGFEGAIDSFLNDLEHEIEGNLEAALLKQKSLATIEGPDGGRCPLRCYYRVRAFILYHFLPHDKSIFGKLKDPVYLCMLLLTLLPFALVRVAFYSVVLAMIVFPRPPDEFQLVNFILLFKGSQFLNAGLITMGKGSMKYFICFSLHPGHMTTCIVERGPGASDSLVNALIDYVGSCVLVWIAFRQLPHSEKHARSKYLAREQDGPHSDKHAKAKTPQESNAGEGFGSGKGGQLGRLLWYDVRCFALSLAVLAVVAVVTWRLEYEQQDFLHWVLRSAHFREDLFWCKVLYGILSLPFLPFSVSFLLKVLTHCEYTGYNEHGGCVAFDIPMNARAPNSPQKASPVKATNEQQREARFGHCLVPGLCSRAVRALPRRDGAVRPGRAARGWRGHHHRSTRNPHANVDPAGEKVHRLAVAWDCRCVARGLLKFQTAAADLNGAARSKSAAKALIEALSAEFEVPDGSVPCQTFEKFSRDFPIAEVQNVSATSIAITRDAFAQVLKKINHDVIAAQSKDASRTLNRDGQETSCFVVVHVHDEAAMKVKSFDFDGAFRPELQNRTVGRYSKVQNQAVCVDFGQARVPVLTELMGMSVKDAPTIAECLIQVFESIARAIKDGCPRATVRIVHVVIGDAAATNEAACKRLFAFLHAAERQLGIRYYLVVVKCAAHQANLVVQCAICGQCLQDPLNSDALCAAASRAFKYVIPGKLWMMSRRHNPMGYSRKCEEFLQVPDDDLDLGYSLALKREAWRCRSLSDAAMWLMADEVQEEIDEVLGSMLANSLDAERKIHQGRTPDHAKARSLAVASRNQLLHQYHVERERFLACRMRAAKQGDKDALRSQVEAHTADLEAEVAARQGEAARLARLANAAHVPVTQRVWLVQKEAFPDVGKDKKVSFWLLGPSEAQGVDHDRVWVLDAHAPTGPCMRGAIRRTIGWKATKDRGSKKPRLEDGDAHASGQSCGAEVAAGSGPAAAPQGMAPAPAALAAASSGMAPGGAEAAPERKRRETLAEHVSSEDNDDVSIKTRRLDCQKACEAGRFYVPGETDTAHFRAKMYVGYLKKQKAEHMKRDSEKSFADELSVESRYFFQYLADWILKGKTHEVIGHFAPLFREAKELRPALVPKIAQAICSIGEVDLLGQFSGPESELEKYGLPPKRISALAGNPFLAGFRKARFEAQFALAKTASSWRGAAPGPAAEQPGGEQPGGEQPGGEQPDGDQPGGVQPGGEQPGGEQPGGERPGGEQPGGEQPGQGRRGKAAAWIYISMPHMRWRALRNGEKVDSAFSWKAVSAWVALQAGKPAPPLDSIDAEFMGDGDVDDARPESYMKDGVMDWQAFNEAQRGHRESKSRKGPKRGQGAKACGSKAVSERCGAPGKGLGFRPSAPRAQTNQERPQGDGRQEDRRSTSRQSTASAGFLPNVPPTVTGGMSRSRSAAELGAAGERTATPPWGAARAHTAGGTVVAAAPQPLLGTEGPPRSAASDGPGKKKRSKVREKEPEPYLHEVWEKYPDSHKKPSDAEDPFLVKLGACKPPPRRSAESEASSDQAAGRGSVVAPAGA